jgi:hypothetical protein
MPATIFSHQALILPLKWRWPHRFSGLALCIGSMAPDLAFIGTMSDDSVFSHTLWAQLWFSAPLTMLLTWLITALLLPRLLPYLQDHSWWRFHALAALEPPRTASEWRRVALSGALGGLSHVLLDGITHGNHTGWLVPHLPVLRTVVPHIGGPVPLHDALQCWLTLLFGAASIAMWRTMVRHNLLWQWRAKAVVSLPRMPRADGLRLLRLTGAAGLHGAAVGWWLHRHDAVKPLAAGIAFGMLDFMLAALVFTALLLHARHRRTRRKLHAVATIA